MSRRLCGLLVVAACATARPPRPSFPDAPLQLRDETARDQAIDQLWTMPHGAARDAVRAGIVTAIARRIDAALQEDKPLVAEQLLYQLASLWQEDPANVGTGLAAEAPLLERLRAVFAKSGSAEPTIASLVLLGEISGGKRTDVMAELDDILGYADDLAAAENGANAMRAQPIALLQPTVLVLPADWLVAKYVALLEARQRVVSDLLVKQGASIQLVRAHHDILSTAHRIAAALARTGKPEGIYAHLATLPGIGTARELPTRAEVIAEPPAAGSTHRARDAREDRARQGMDRIARRRRDRAGQGHAQPGPARRRRARADHRDRSRAARCRCARAARHHLLQDRPPHRCKPHAGSRPRDAAVLYLTAMHDWSELLKAPQPPKSLLAEGQLEAGRGLWFLGHTDRAVDLVLSATEEDADSASTFASAVSFLIQVDRPVDALDALHRALSADVGELYKVYMCLWVLGDERRRGEARDRQAVEYLGSRHGDLWYAQLAEAATGRLDFATLRANANTAPRQAELAFYGVTLGLDPEAAAPAYVKKKLIEVFEAGLVMDAEYDLARLYLSTP